MSLRGATPSTVHAAIDDADPFPGTSGFAGAVDGRLVRDVLGRVPLYVERDALGADAADLGTPIDAAETRESADVAGLETPADAADAGTWAFSPRALAEPALFPAGSIADGDGLRRRWRLPDPEPERDHGRALDRLERAFDVATAAVDADVAVAFSGGVDSALVGAALEAPCYVVGFPGSHDVEAARTAAAAMGADLEVVTVDHADVTRAVPIVARATGRTDAMAVSIALGLFLAAERVAADGFDALAVGQGADELFGGYEKVARLDDRVAADTVRGAVREQLATLPTQLPRDVLAIEAAGVEPVAPYLQDAVVEAALELPEALLVDGHERKVGLRRIAARRLPATVAEREKKAVQYGSLIARELDRLARRAGYKRRMDDHVRLYVESLLEDCSDRE